MSKDSRAAAENGVAAQRTAGSWRMARCERQLAKPPQNTPGQPHTNNP